MIYLFGHPRPDVQLSSFAAFLLTDHRLSELFVGAASPSKAGIIRGNRYAKLHIYILIHTLEGRRAFVGLTMSWVERCVGNRRSRLA